MSINTGPTNENLMRLARGLGWFSIGLGMAELLAPGSISNLTGLPRRKGLIRLFGLREIASGLAIFAQRKPAAALWSRVAGDGMDLGVLGAAMAARGAERGKLASSLAAVAGVTALDFYVAQEVSRREAAQHGRGQVEETVIINKPAEELYSFWRNFEDLPRFMAHLKSVEKTGPTRSHWVARGPMNRSVEWDAEIVHEKPNELISWRSVEGADVDNAGTVRFEPAPGGRGTLVRVKLDYAVPGGALGSAVAKVFGESPEKQVPVDLRRFKQLMETGEIARTEGQPAGRMQSTSKKFDDWVRK